MKKVFFVLSLFAGFLSASDFCDVDEAPCEGISISGIPKVEIIKTFYEVALPVGYSGKSALPLTMEEVVKEVIWAEEIDYLNGRAMKIHFCNNEMLEVGQFNWFYGKGKAQELIAVLREKLAALNGQI